ncbi:MAG: hypothetical protein OHK0013_05750 [Sandaracinaceae bacterium]
MQRRAAAALGVGLGALLALGLGVAVGVGLDPAAVTAQRRLLDPLAMVQSSDPLELARVVDRLGDEAVLARLGPVGGEGAPALPIVMAAVRASPWLHAPEAALPRLAELAGGRDPDLAPAAMLAVVRIAERLTRAELDGREASDAPITAALPALAALAEDATARNDLRRAASRARALLQTLVEG